MLPYCFRPTKQATPIFHICHTDFRTHFYMEKPGSQQCLFLAYSICKSLWKTSEPIVSITGLSMWILNVCGCDPEFYFLGYQYSFSLCLSPSSPNPPVCLNPSPSLSFVPPHPSIHTDQTDPGYIMESHSLHWCLMCINEPSCLQDYRWKDAGKYGNNESNKM